MWNAEVSKITKLSVGDVFLSGKAVQVVFNIDSSLGLLNFESVLGQKFLNTFHFLGYLKTTKGHFEIN